MNPGVQYSHQNLKSLYRREQASFLNHRQAKPPIFKRPNLPKSFPNVSRLSPVSRLEPGNDRWIFDYRIKKKQKSWG
jgi:hypothetical protein